MNVVPFFSSWIVFNTNTFINYSCRFHFVNCVYLFICIPLRIILPVWNFIQSRRRSPGVSWCANPTDFTVRMKMQMKKINYTFFHFFICIRRKNIIHYNNTFFFITIIQWKKKQKKYKKLKHRWNSYKIRCVVQWNHSHRLYPRTKTVQKGDGENRKNTACYTLGYHVTNW